MIFFFVWRSVKKNLQNDMEIVFCLQTCSGYFSISRSCFSRLFKTKYFDFGWWKRRAIGRAFSIGNHCGPIKELAWVFRPLRYLPCAGQAVHPFRLCRSGVAGLILNLFVFFAIRAKPLGPPGFRCPFRGSRGKSSGRVPSASTQIEALKWPCPTKTSSGARRWA